MFHMLPNFFYSETPAYGHPVITATFFGGVVKTAIHFRVNKTPRLYGYPVNTARFFWPIVDRIKGGPLYVKYV